MRNMYEGEVSYRVVTAVTPLGGGGAVGEEVNWAEQDASREPNPLPYLLPRD